MTRYYYLFEWQPGKFTDLQRLSGGDIDGPRSVADSFMELMAGPLGVHYFQRVELPECFKFSTSWDECWATHVFLISTEPMTDQEVLQLVAQDEITSIEEELKYTADGKPNLYDTPELIRLAWVALAELKKLVR